MWKSPSLCCLLAAAHLYFLISVHSQGTDVPITPRIRKLTANFSTRTLKLKWKDGGSAVSSDADVTWEIRILRKDPMETVAVETYHSKLTRKKNTIVNWSWTSDIPLECTTHYVQIRCSHRLEGSSVTTSWSEWSPLASIPGRDTGNFLGAYPIDEIKQVGSNLIFCCVWRTRERLESFEFYSNPPIKSLHIHLSNWSVMIHVPNVDKSQPYGTNVVCLTDPPDITGTVVFVGYPPDSPQNLSCETSNFKEITCEWKEGRETNLYSLKGRTKYNLFESISGKTVIHDGEKIVEIYRCNFPVLDNQRIYNFTVHAYNPLGQAESSISIDINYRVCLQTPAKLFVIDIHTTRIILIWYLSGNLAPIKLWCQVRMNSNGDTEVLDVQLNGVKDSQYRASLENLHPYTKYTFQVRCSAAEPFFWKWSKWSETIQHTTLEARSGTQTAVALQRRHSMY